MPGLSIGKLAKAANVSIDTIRFYEKRGLLPAPARRASGFRDYSSHDVRHLIFVRRARALGFALEEIAELLTLMPQQTVDVAARVIDDKLATIDTKIAELQRWRTALQGLLHSSEPSGSTTRSILDLFDEPTEAGSPFAARFHDHPL